MSVAVQSSPIHLTLRPSPVRLTLSANLVSALKRQRGVLRAHIQLFGTVVTVYPGGEVDAANTDSWRQLLREAAAATPSPGQLVIHTDGLDFMGGCAFNALAEEAYRCHSRGIRMCLVGRRPGLRQLVTASGLGSRLPVYPDAATALSAAVET
jgi:anti-anti-sigma factor